MIAKLVLMMVLGIIFGICISGLIVLMVIDYREMKEDEEFDDGLRDMEQYFIAEYYKSGKDGNND